MYNYVFQRVEKKYLLTKDEKDKLLKKINSYLEEDKFFKSKICNIYFDTDNDDLIINSMEKPEFKEKFRLRCYNTPKLDDIVFLEMKEKYKGVVGKRRVRIKLSDFYNYLDNHKFKKTQIMKEIDYYFEHFNLKPSIMIAYDRRSYCGKDNKNLRITFDNNLRSRRDNLYLEKGSDGEQYFDEDYYLMEIKTLDSFPLWLVKALSELKIYPTTFSKYGKIYEKERSEILC